MCAYSIDSQEPQGKEYPAFKLGYTEDVLKTIDNAHNKIKNKSKGKVMGCTQKVLLSHHFDFKI